MKQSCLIRLQFATSKKKKLCMLRLHGNRTRILLLQKFFFFSRHTALVQRGVNIRLICADAHDCNSKFAVFWLLCCRMITCKWVLFPGIDVYVYQLVQIIEKYIRLATACMVKTATGVQCLCSTSEKALLSSCLFVSHCYFLFVCAATNRAIQRLEQLELRHI